MTDPRPACTCGQTSKKRGIDLMPLEHFRECPSLWSQQPRAKPRNETQMPPDSACTCSLHGDPYKAPEQHAKDCPEYLRVFSVGMKATKAMLDQAPTRPEIQSMINCTIQRLVNILATVQVDTVGFAIQGGLNPRSAPLSLDDPDPTTIHRDKDWQWGPKVHGGHPVPSVRAFLAQTFPEGYWVCLYEGLVHAVGPSLPEVTEQARKRGVAFPYVVRVVEQESGTVSMGL